MADESSESVAVTAPKRQKVDRIAELKEKLAQLPTKFDLPSWAGEPPAGLHIDVMKDGKLVQKVMVDEKACYLFGRNRDICDFSLEHESASRLHAAIVWHKQLQRAFLIDCGSVHGTFVGKLRLEAHKPTQVPLGAELHFGASTRTYVVRERPKSAATFNPRSLLAAERQDDDGQQGFSVADGGVSNLPESESEIDNLTEFNTMHNRRVGTLTDILDPPRRLDGRSRNVHFRDQADVINPEDVDPSVGRFRNLCSTQLVLTAKTVAAAVPSAPPPTTAAAVVAAVPRPRDSVAMRPSVALSHAVLTGGSSVLAKLGLSVNIAPDIAPEVASQDADLYYGMYADVPPPPPPPSSSSASVSAGWRPPNAQDSRSRSDDEPRKKKYAKEAWPGRHPPSVGLHS